MIKFSLSKGIIETVNIIDKAHWILSRQPQRKTLSSFYRWGTQNLQRQLILVQKNNSLKQTLEFGQKEKQEKIWILKWWYLIF